ncbi:hypothetical protein FGO68_gene11586 [Halteria grandinella]|uniref:Uncharacterized protein n=1 Tax=Halteria grandinella TaxID=5974 RepID=A0A8J8NWH3_HALGN|nr:hypothetical protein FGO68_gene11586 [Halteria grandinella]
MASAHTQASDENATESIPSSKALVAFPVRPKKSNFASPVKLMSNCFRLINNHAGGQKDIQKYSVKYDPEIPDTSKIEFKVEKSIRDEAKKDLENYFLVNKNIYSYTLMKDDKTYEGEHEGVKYQVTIAWSKSIKNGDIELYSFYSLFFKQLMKKMSFERLGRNCFNPKAAVKLSNHGLEIWPGFYSAMQKLDGGALIQIDLTNKVIRQDTVLSFIQELESKGKSREFINQELQFKVVVTSYGKDKRTYRVERVDFDRSPESTFPCKDGTQISFGAYFKKQYNIDVREINQPLLVSKNERTGTEICLIPEICEMTGLTDQHRANFNLMKDMAQILHKSPMDRREEAKKLIQEMEKQERVKKHMDLWGLRFDPTPMIVDGQKIPGSQIVMGKGKEFAMEVNGNDFDRNIQQEMFSQLPLQKWGIFYEQFHVKEAQQFASEIEKCLSSCNFQFQKPALFQIQGRGYQSWENELKSKLNPQVTAVVLICPGKKTDTNLYNPLKKLLISTLPVPSQVVLAQTISRGKNLRSICSKILIQINAKIGGVPWTVKNPPFFNRPAMIVGYDVHHQRGQKSMLAVCCTINQSGTKYCAKVHPQDGENVEIASHLTIILGEMLEQFNKINKIYPEKIVFYRDGVGESQKSVVMQREMEQIDAALKEKGLTDKCKYAFIMVNKRVKTKIIWDNNGRLENPRSGTVLDHSITPQNTYDFYLVSQNCRQGVATPSHYSILVDQMKSEPEDLMKLTHYMTYLYYNFSGPVKIPAPVKYADRLAKMIGERQNIKPHEHFQNINGLYFI